MAENEIPKTTDHRTVRRVLRFMRKQAGIVGLTGLLGYIGYRVLKAGHSEELATGLLTLGKDLKIEVEAEFNKLKGAMAAVLLTVVGMILLVIYQATVMTDGYIVGDFWHSRIPVLFIAILVMMALVFHFASVWIVPFLAIDGIERFIKKDKFHGEGITVKVLRFVGKWQGWIFFGLVPAIVASFWHHPILMWAGVIATPNYIYFTNSWRRGESENTRRAILWMTGFWQATCIALTPFPRVVDWLFDGAGVYWWRIGGNLLSAHWWTMAAMVLLAAVEITIAIFLGKRKTAEDHGRDAVLPELAAITEMQQRGASLADVVAVSTLVRQNMPRGSTSTVQPNGGQGSDQTVKPQPRSRKGLMAIILILGGLILIHFALPHIGWTNFNPSIPSDGVTNMAVTMVWLKNAFWGLCFVGAVAFLLSRKSSNG